MRILRTIAVAAIGAVAAAGGALADVDSSYFGLRGSFAFVNGDRSAHGGIPLRSSYDTGKDLSVVFGGASGDRRGMGVRFELEGQYRYIRQFAIERTGPRALHNYRGLNLFVPMVNVLYDPAIDSPVRPFVGVGAGAAYRKLDRWNFSYQLLVGLRMNVTDTVISGLSFRHLTIVDMMFRTPAGAPYRANLTSNDIELSLDFLL